MPLLAMLTDFGYRDQYVGVMKAVIYSIAPAARVIDLGHDVPPQDLLSGAYLLDASHDYLPHGAVIVAVVDPGVGTNRRAICAKIDGRFYIAPDNGLLGLLLARAKLEQLVNLDNTSFHLSKKSSTFHGRDIFSPCGAHLCAGVELAALGQEIEASSLVSLPELSATRQGDTLTGQLLHVDHFGNLITTIPASMLSDMLDRAHPTFTLGEHTLPFVSTFAEVPEGALLAYIGSSGRLEIAARDADASALLGLPRDARLSIRCER